MSEPSQAHSKLSTPSTSSNSEIEDELLELTDIDKFKNKSCENGATRPKNPITVQLQLLSQHFQNLWSTHKFISTSSSSHSPSSSSDDEILGNGGSAKNITGQQDIEIQDDNSLKKIPDLNVDIIEEEVKKELEEVEKLEGEMNRNLSKKPKIIQPSQSVNKLEPRDSENKEP